MRVLEGVSIGTATRGPATAQRAGEKIFERREIQTAAVACIKELIHRGASKLIAKLQIMSGELPRKVIDQVEIAVDSRAWNRKRGADVSDTPLILNANLGQAKVAFIRDAGVESNRARIEIVVFGKESFVKPVVAESQLVNFRWRKNLQIRERYEMNRSWGGRVETGENVAGKNRERERLIARAVKIAAGKLVVFVE